MEVRSTRVTRVPAQGNLLPSFHRKGAFTRVEVHLKAFQLVLFVDDPPGDGVGKAVQMRVNAGVSGGGVINVCLLYTSRCV